MTNHLKCFKFTNDRINNLPKKYLGQTLILACYSHAIMPALGQNQSLIRDLQPIGAMAVMD